MSTRIRLVLASTLMLFLELALIRWSGAQVVHLSYFSNFVLLGSFLGIGLGFLRAARPGRRPPLYSPVALLALIGFVSAYPVTVDRESSSVIFFTSLATSGPPLWATLPIVFLSVAAMPARRSGSPRWRSTCGASPRKASTRHQPSWWATSVSRV